MNLFYFNAEICKCTASLFSSEELHRVGQLIAYFVDGPATHDSRTAVFNRKGMDWLNRPRWSHSKTNSPIPPRCKWAWRIFCHFVWCGWFNDLLPSPTSLRDGGSASKSKLENVQIYTKQNNNYLRYNLNINKKKIYNGGAKAVEVVISPKY